MKDSSVGLTTTRMLLWSLVVWCGCSILVVVAATTLDEESSTSSSSIECGVYLAPSTIPHAGMGMFAGKDYASGSSVTYGDLVIPLEEITWHNGNDGSLNWLWDEYVWSKEAIPSMEFETPDGEDVDAASPGIGAAINCMLPLINLEDTFTQLGDAGTTRLDPTSGSFTPFHNRRGVATKDIDAGDELFIDYGESYFEYRLQSYGPIPLHKNYKKADKVLQRYKRLLGILQFRQQHQQPQQPSRSAADDAVGGGSVVLKDDLVRDLYSLMVRGWKEGKPRTGNAFPSNHTRVNAVLDSGGTAMQEKNRSRVTSHGMVATTRSMRRQYPGRSIDHSRSRKGGLCHPPDPQGRVGGTRPPHSHFQQGPTHHVRHDNTQRRRWQDLPQHIETYWKAAFAQLLFWSS